MLGTFRSARRAIAEVLGGVALATVLATGSSAADSTDPTPPVSGAADALKEVEQTALAALVEQDQDGLKALVQKIAGLSAMDRQNLPVRARASAMEFRFRGQFPGPAISNVEYVVSKAGDKDHESLLAVNPAELNRLMQLRKALDQLVMAGHLIRLDVRMLWNEEGKMHAEDLEDILALAPGADRTKFSRELKIDDSGLGAFNIVHEPTTLPTKPLAAEVHVTIRVSKK